MTVSRRRFISDVSRASLLALGSSALMPGTMFSAEENSANPAPETMTVGVGACDITGEPGPELTGFLARHQPSTQIGTHLYARVLFLCKGRERLVWISVDSLGFTQEIVKRVKKSLSQKFAIEPCRVVLSATHTHSAPSASRLTNLGDYDDHYVENILLPGIDSAAMMAKHSTEECFLVEATGEADLSIDRRGAATKHTEKRVPALGWKRPDGSFKAVLVGYTMHPVCHSTGLIHAEWPGAVADAIGEAFSPNTTPFVIQGACGNVNPKEASVTDEQMQKVGRTIVGTIAEQLKNAKPIPPYFAVRGRRLAVLLNVHDEKTIEEFGRSHYNEKAGPEDIFARKANHASAVWKKWAMKQLHEGGADYVEADIAAIVIGHRAFVTAPFETLSWMNLELAKHTNVDCFAMGYTNGCYNYLAHDAAYDEGGYEPDSAKLWYRNFPMKRGELERLALNSATLVELAAQTTGLMVSR